MTNSVANGSGSCSEVSSATACCEYAVGPNARHTHNQGKCDAEEVLEQEKTEGHAAAAAAAAADDDDDDDDFSSHLLR